MLGGLFERIPEGARLGLYCRISSDENAGEEHKAGPRQGKQAREGVERQEARGRALAARENWVLADRHIYVDDNISGWSGKRRPAYERMVADVRAGQLDVVWAYHLDRLARSVMALYELCEVLAEHDVRLYTDITGPMEFRSATGRLMLTMLGAIAEFESALRSERMLAFNEMAAKKGWRVGGRRPFGFMPNGVTHDEREADAIQKAAVGVIQGQTLGSVARTWNAAGLLTPPGNEWEITAVSDVLQNARNAGQREYRGKTVKAEWDPIITLDQLAELRRILRDPARRTNGRPSKYLLTGLLFCHCGGKMIAHPTEGRRAMRCKDQRGGGGHAVLRGIDAAEEIVGRAVLARIPGGSLRALLDRSEDTAPIADALAEVEAKMATQAARFAAGEIAEVEYEAMASTWRAQQARLRAQLEARRQDRSLDGLPDPLPDWDLPEADGGLVWHQRRALIRHFIEAVEVGPGRHRGVSGFDRDRLRISWQR